MDEKTTALVPAGGIVKQGFGDLTVSHQRELLAGGAAAREQVIVQSRFVMAMQRPRDVDTFRARLLKEASRPGMAEVSEYARPVGREKNKITGEWEEKIAKGPTIHLLRVALQLYGNNSSEPTILVDDDSVRSVRVTLSDYETNFHVSRDVTFEKKIEKRGTKRRGSKEEEQPDREILGTRTNTYGDVVYICRMNLDEVRKEESRLVALAKRALAEEFLPRDIVREALAKAVATKESEVKKDPDAAKKKLVDAFAELGIAPADLVQYLQHSLDRVTTAELLELRTVWSTIHNNEATWEEIMIARDPVGSIEEAERVAQERIAALSGSNKNPNASEAKGDTAGAGKQASGAGETEARIGQARDASGPGTDAAPATGKTGKTISKEQLNQLVSLFVEYNLTDEQVNGIVSGAGAARIDQIQASVFDTVVSLVKLQKGGKK